MNRDLLRKELIRDEALRLFPYKCSQGKTTIGIGHNLDDKGISPEVAELIFNNDLREVETLLDEYLPWWRSLSETRQRAVANMAFNLGVGPSKEDPNGKLLTFKNTLAAMKRGDYQTAANGMQNSLWARQVGARADRLVRMMEEG